MGLIIIILSTFSYFFIEKPFRNKKNNFKIILPTLLIFISIIIIFSGLVIKNDGYNSRMPKNLQSVTNEESHKLLKDSEGQQCLQKVGGCEFNLSYNNNIYLIGDSHAAALAFDLKERILDKNYRLTTYLIGECGFFPGFNLVEKTSNKINKHCNAKYFNKVNRKLLEAENSIIIFHARMPLYLENNEAKWDKSYVSNGEYNSLDQSFLNTFNNLSKKNKIILIYPVHEAGINVHRKLLNNHLKNLFRVNKNLNKDNIISIPEDEYFKISKKTFQLFDKLNNKNIFRIYPHKVFCNTILKNRCVSNSYEEIYYFDETHLSLLGTKKVNEMVIKKLESIKY